MANLESVVLPLAESRALVEHDIVLDTVLAWKWSPLVDAAVLVPHDKGVREQLQVPAPTFSELLDAIRAKADAIEERMNRGMELERHEEEEQILYELVGQGHGNCEDDWQQAVGKGSTDLLAACALLLEVAK